MDNLFLIILWLISIFGTLFLGAVISDVLFPFLRRRRELREMRRLREMGYLPAFLRRQAD